MPIEITEAEVRYIGNGEERLYSIPFPILEPAHLHVSCESAAGDKVTLLSGTDYQVRANKSVSGNLRYAELELARPLPVNWKLTVSRIVPLTQEILIHNQGPNSPKVVSDALDKLTMISQQLDHAIHRADRFLQETAGRTVELAASIGALEKRVGVLAALMHPELHAASHASGKSDAIDPKSIGALTERHLNEENPHPQYAATTGVTATREGLESSIAALAVSSHPKLHSATHAVGQDDAIIPEAIGALGQSHLEEENPHPQYAFLNPDATVTFFEYDPLQKLLRLREWADGDAESGLFAMRGNGLLTLKK